MSPISIDEIKQNPQSFVHRVEAGESLVVLRGADPIAEVKPIPGSPRTQRPFGLCAGMFRVPADFDESLAEEVIAEFEGRRN